MKKLAILITIIFLLSACTTPTLVDISESEVSLEIDEKNYESELNHEINNYGVPPLYNSLDFDSVDELIDAISDEIIDEIIEVIEEEKDDDEQLFRELVSDLQNDSLYIPNYQGTEILYRNQEGFYNVILFPSELYEKPWIMYFPDREQSGIERISIMYLDDDINTTENQNDIPKLISEIAPEAPNIHNYHEFPRFAEIYTSELQLSERKVATLIQEIKDDVRRNIFFVYDDVLVMMVTKNEKIPYEWLNDFSFSTNKEDLS